MGLLDSIFGGGDSGFQKTGSASPVTLGLLALLAYKAYQKYGGSLGDMMSQGAPAGNPAGTPRIPPGAQPSGQGSGNVFGGNAGGVPGSSPFSGGMPDLGSLLKGGLGGLLGGAAAGGILNGGLGDLLKRFQQNGLGATADSWVSRGPNQAIDTQSLERALGRDTLEDLSTHTGRPYDQVLSELSESLPNTVDKLTPEGRPPTNEEASRWV